MSRKSYQQQIDDLRANVVEMSEAVVDQLRTAVEAVEHRDGELGREAIERDTEINRRYLDIEGDCVDLLALQQPVAGDLRFIVASFKIVTDLERVGDLATNLGQYAAAERDRYPAVDVGQLGAVAAEMVEDATRAYVEEDPDLCREIDARDDHLDELCDRASRTVTEELLATEAPDADTEAVVDDVRRLLLTIRDLERVGDHAVNVAGRTLYAVENDESLLR